MSSTLFVSLRERLSAVLSPHIAVVTVTCLTYFTITLDVSMVNVAAPAVGRGWGMSLGSWHWIVNAYTLVLGALLISSGSLADRFGADRIMRIGFVILTASSVWCAFSLSPFWLYVGRVSQGIGTAAILPAALSLIKLSMDEPKSRATAIALTSAAGGFGVAIGPIIGGALTRGYGWPSVFLINIPLGVISLLVLTLVPAVSRKSSTVDWGGQMCALAVFVSLTFVLLRGKESGWTSAATLLLCTVFCFSVVVMLWWESRAHEPMMPLTLWRSPQFATSIGVGLTANMSFFGILFALSLYYQSSPGTDSLSAGVMILPTTVLVMVGNLLAGSLIARYGPRLSLIMGQGVSATGYLALFFLLPDGSLLLFALLSVLVGVGMGITAPSMTITMLDTTPRELTGAGSGMLNSARQVGSLLGTALFGSLLAGMGGIEEGLAVSTMIAFVVTTAAGLASLCWVKPKPTHTIPQSESRNS